MEGRKIIRYEQLRNCKWKENRISAVNSGYCLPLGPTLTAHTAWPAPLSLIQHDLPLSHSYSMTCPLLTCSKSASSAIFTLTSLLSSTALDLKDSKALGSIPPTDPSEDPKLLLLLLLLLLLAVVMVLLCLCVSMLLLPVPEARHGLLLLRPPLCSVDEDESGPNE